jgi:NADPH-dependent glutamate synthase beta subunit-like oxidoreductase/NAD-dependent dihydropyrimidine dehydrogenase PreA subunit
MTRPKDRLQKVIVIGATPAGIAAVNKLGELGLSVTLVDGDADLNQKLADNQWRLSSGVPFNFAHRPGIIRILRNPRIHCLLPARVETIKHNPQGFSVTLTREPTFVDPRRCTLCGRCVEVCPVREDNGAAALQFHGRFSLPGRPVIDKRRTPLCRENCPLGVNAQGYVALAKAGRYAEALALIRQNNILPGICGRICTHPCETACRRGELDEAVSIRAIKRFLSDWEVKNETVVNPPTQPFIRKESFAVIGSGPAGLAAAAQLARHGCRATVFDREAEAGGLLRYGIGAHRLPRQILNNEIAYIQKMGVIFNLSHPVDLNNDLQKLQAQFDGVIVASGTWRDRKLGVAGETLEGVLGCLEFLSRYYRKEITQFSGHAAVIGDGNAAFDLARTLVRLGATVTLVSWFEKEKIPADREEVTAAEDEGVTIIDRLQVMSFEGREGRLTALRGLPTKPGPPDANGIAWPVPIPDAAPVTLTIDHAFVAIGQCAPPLEPGALQIGSHGYIAVDEAWRTPLPWVYGTGDAVSGPSSVVQAMARGKAAADQVLMDICHLPDIATPCQRPMERDFPAIAADRTIQHRTPMPEMQPAIRKQSDAEVAMGLTESQVAYEATRCLQCGVCAECLQCVDACGEIGAIRHQDGAQSLVEQAGVVIIADPQMAPAVRGDDIVRAYGPATAKVDVHAMILRGFAAAAQAMVMLSVPGAMPKGRGVSFYQPDTALPEADRIGVFVCKCNSSLGWLDEMDDFIQALKEVRGVVYAESITAACVPEGATGIIRTVRDRGINRIVLGACVCCSLNFVCSACTDQRSRLKHQLFTATGIGRSMVVTRNIRGEALSLLSKDPARALTKFKGLLTRSINNSRRLKPFSTPSRNYNFAAAVIGQSQAALYSALTLARTGMDVFLFADQPGPEAGVEAHGNIHWFEGAIVKQISGTLGDFTLEVQSGALDQRIHVGAVILGEASRKRIGYVHQKGLPPRRIACAMQRKAVLDIPFFHPGMTSISGLFLANPPGIAISNRQKGEAAAVLAAAVMPRDPRKSKGFTVVVDKPMCRGCGRCVDVCPYQAVSLRPNISGAWYAFVDAAFCKGCGNCISVCPSNAVDSPYRDQVFYERMLEDILMPEGRMPENELPPRLSGVGMETI